MYKRVNLSECGTTSLSEYIKIALINPRILHHWMRLMTKLLSRHQTSVSASFSQRWRSHTSPPATVTSNITSQALTLDLPPPPPSPLLLFFFYFLVISPPSPKLLYIYPQQTTHSPPLSLSLPPSPELTHHAKSDSIQRLAPHRRRIRRSTTGKHQLWWGWDDRRRQKREKTGGGKCCGCVRAAGLLHVPRGQAPAAWTRRQPLDLRRRWPEWSWCKERVVRDYQQRRCRQLGGAATSGGVCRRRTVRRIGRHHGRSYLRWFGA